MLVDLAVAAMVVTSGKAVTNSLTWPEIVLAIIGLVLFGPVFFIVAITGRPPRWWGNFDDALNIEETLRGYVERRNRK